MNLKQVKQYLREIQRLDALIRCKTAEIVQLRELALSITVQSSSEPVMTSKNPDKIGTVVAKIVDLQDEAAMEIDRFLDVRQERIAVIEKVADVKHYDILHQRYVQYRSLKQISIEMKLPYDSVKTLHLEALRSVESILGDKKAL